VAAGGSFLDLHDLLVDGGGIDSWRAFRLAFTRPTLLDAVRHEMDH
jgi:hypothetical protein